MQLTRDSDSDGIDGTGAGGATSVVTADRFILCHSVLETMETLGRCMGFRTNQHVIWTWQEYQTTFRIQDGFKGIEHSQGFLANQLLNTVKFEC